MNNEGFVVCFVSFIKRKSEHWDDLVWYNMDFLFSFIHKLPIKKGQWLCAMSHMLNKDLMS